MLGTWISLLVGVTALLAFLGTGTVFVLSGRQKVRISDLETAAADLEKTAVRLRADVADRDQRDAFKDHQLAQCQARVRTLEGQVDALERIKVGEAYYEALHEQVEAHSTRVLANHDRIHGELEVIRKQNRDVLALLADQRRNQ